MHGSFDPLGGGRNIILPPQGHWAHSFAKRSLWLSSWIIPQLPKRRTKPPFCKKRQIATTINDSVSTARKKQRDHKIDGVRMAPDTPKKPRMVTIFATNDESEPRNVQKAAFWIEGM